MGLIDPGIVFQNDPNAMMNGAKQGMGLMQQVQQFQQQRDDRSRTEAARRAFAQAAQGEDITKPEGMGRAIQKFAQAGFPQEASAVLEAHKDMFPQTKPKQTEYDKYEGNDGAYYVNKSDPKDVVRLQYDGQAVKPPERKTEFAKTADKWNGTSWVLSNGSKVLVDAEGRDKNGNLIAVDKPAPKPEKVGNVAGAMQSRSLLSDWGKSRFDYEKAAKPYLALKAIKNSPSYGTGVGDQSMIDKIIMIETGKVPTEAQYFQFAHNLGIEDKIDRVTGRLKAGAILGQEARDNIEHQADEQMKIAHDAYNTDYSQAEGMARQNNIDPAKVLRKGGYHDEVGKMLSAKAAGAAPASNASPEKIAKAKQYMALPPDSPYRTPAHDAAAKAILGIK